MNNHRFSFGRGFLWVALVIMATLSASCDGVQYEEYEPYLTAPNAEIYQFDISVLSEWGGAIEPENKNVVFCLKDHVYFRAASIGYLPYAYPVSTGDDLSTITLDLSAVPQDGDEDETGSPAPVPAPVVTTNQVVCRKLGDKNADHYGIKNACLNDVALYGENREELYLCFLNFNTLDLDSVDKAWHDLFPELAYTVDRFKLSNVPVCIKQQDDQLYLRPNEDTAVVSLTSEAPIQVSSDDQNIRIQLIRSRDEGEDKVEDYEVMCSVDTSLQTDQTLCIFEGETPYSCQTRIGGATGLSHIWEDIFRRDKIPMYIASNGDNFGMTKANSREFNDIPTLQLLSTLHLNVDTFGNHAFDKDIASLSRVVERSNYPYVVSNLKNVPQNLRGVSPFTIWQVPPSESKCSSENTASCCRSADNPDGADCLSVAVVSALESTVKDYVYPGLFGSLDVTDYCDVLYAMQEAYNANARAFFVLAHISTESDYRIKETELADGKLVFSYAESGGKYILTSDRRVNIFTLLQTLFSMQGYYPDLCPENHLIIPDYRIQSKMTFCPVICSSDETGAQELCMNQCNRAYEKSVLIDRDALERQVIHEINKEIFDSIIGIFTASGDEHLVGFTTETLDDNAPEGMIQFRMNATHFGDAEADFPGEPYFFDNDYLYTKNLFQNTPAGLSPLTNSELASVFGVSAFNVSEERFGSIYKKLKSHPIWVIRMPDGGESTANFRITMTRQHAGDQRPDVYGQPYVASLDFAEILPTVHSPENVGSVTPHHCLSYLKQLALSDVEVGASISNVADTCSDFTHAVSSDNPVAQACSCYNYFHHVQSYAMDEDDEEPSYLACADYLQRRSQQYLKDSLQTSELQSVWQCIYKAKTADICSDSDKWDMSESEKFAFKDRVLFDLKLLDGSGDQFTKYISTLEENELRSQTTFIGNLVADMMLSYFNANSSTDRYDVSLINAGALNLLSDVRLTQHTQETLKALSPFENGFLSIELTPSSFVNYITHGIGSRDDNRGQYPLLSGVIMSTVNLDGANQITELWSRHHPDEFMPYGCTEEDGETCQCTVKQDDGTCLVRHSRNLLHEPLYQLIDMKDVTDVVYDVADPQNDNCEQILSNNSHFTDIFVDDHHVNHAEDVYIFDPREFHWQGSARFESFIFGSSDEAQKYKLTSSYCSANNNNKLFNVYYKNQGNIESNRFYPMILHVDKETLHSAATPRQVCKCYLTLADSELEPGQTEAGFTTDPTQDNIKFARENNIDDIYETHHYSEPLSDAIYAKKIHIALVDFIANGGDNFELPKYVDPSRSEGNKPDVMLDAYPPAGTTHDVLGEFFDTGTNSTCSSLTENPISMDGRRDIDIAWDNAFYHHIDVTNTVDKTNVFIMERPRLEAPLARYGQYIIDGIDRRLNKKE